jgi:hypothetical protein
MEQEIIVPTTLNDITVEQYQAFLRIQDNNDSEEFIAQKMVSIFCKIKLSQVLRIKYSSITEILAGFNEMFQEKPKLKQTFFMNDVEFGFIPDLENMSFGEYVDLETNVGDWQTIHKAMAVMYRPITKKKGDKYEIQEYEGTANYSEVMKLAPLGVTMGAMLFFYHLSNDLLKATQSYLVKELTEMSIQQKDNSTLNGDGITASMHSLEEMLENLITLQNSESYNVLPI